MKSRFSTLDLMAILPQLSSMLGMRVSQIYDIDHKTYLIKLSRTATEAKTLETDKKVLLIESGIRIHSTEYDWPKTTAPSGFTMKLRKHLKNKRLEKISQLGVDRVVDLQFGTNEAAYHIILELYDRGNIVITDYQYTILNILRPRKAGTDDDVKLVVRGKYPIESAKQQTNLIKITESYLSEIFSKVKENEPLKKILNPHFIYGSVLIEHCLIEVGFEGNARVRDGIKNVGEVVEAIQLANDTMFNISNVGKGYILQKVSKRLDESEEDVITYQEFHPFLFNQHKNLKNDNTVVELDYFDKAVDTFFSSVEGQKIDAKALQMEKAVLKKVDNIRKDHQNRVEALEKLQKFDKQKANLIQLNSDAVDRALLVIRSAIASQMSWEDISDVIQQAQAKNDPVATLITGLKLETNQFVMKLCDPYDDETDTTALVDIDIDLSAHANARKYFDMKRSAEKKEQKTLESSGKALKNAEKKAFQTLKEVAVKTNIRKARKPLWFEKFFWFISSENYLVIGGRDAQQNEMIVKRYMRPGDVYVHADLHGASSVIVKNHLQNEPIPPKTLNEAGTMAICYSQAWDAKVVTSAWWVYPDQVSKAAPTGEYLTIGAFMIRGKKNYLPLSLLVLGFGALFKLDDESVEKHKKERRMRTTSETVSEMSNDTDLEIHISDDSDDEEETIKFPDTKPKLMTTSSVEESTKDNDEGIYKDIFDDQPTIIQSKQPKVKTQQAHKSRQKQAEKILQKKAEEEKEIVGENSNKGNPIKRGQRSKLKKIKEKYRDQDEEERQLRMEILGSIPKKKVKGGKDGLPISLAQQSGTKPVTNSKLGKLSSEVQALRLDGVVKDPNILEERVSEEEKQNDTIEQEVKSDEESDEEVEISTTTQDDLELLETFTGQPLSDDVLLFSLPFCAPYSAMQNFKFKVKVMPGTNRRGKAAKTALQLFLKEKTATQREKDLIKSLKDQDISRNLPGKIKIAASNLTSVKGKHKHK